MELTIIDRPDTHELSGRQWEKPENAGFCPERTKKLLFVPGPGALEMAGSPAILLIFQNSSQTVVRPQKRSTFLIVVVPIEQRCRWIGATTYSVYFIDRSLLTA